jgi:hypothetical protein
MEKAGMITGGKEKKGLGEKLAALSSTNLKCTALG